MFNSLTKEKKDDINVGKKIRKKEMRIESVMEKTGWTREETINTIEAQKKRYGITYGAYDKYNLHTAPAEGFNEEYFSRKWKRKQRTMCVKETIEKTGWTREEAKAHIKSARERLGISYNDYRKYRFYRIPEDVQAEKYAEIVEQKQLRKEESRNRFRQERENHIKTVMDATGWDRQLTLDMQKRSAAVAGCDYEHYAVYNLYDLTEEEQKTYFTARYTRALRKRYNIDPEIIHIFRNKDKTCELLKDFLGRPCESTVDMTFDAFKEAFGQENKIIYKPLASYGGKNVEVFDLCQANLEAVYNKIMELPDGIVEGFLKQHPEMAKLSLKSVNTIRVATVKSNQSFENVEQDKLYFLYAGLRVGSGSSYVDNLHSGGLICGIDLETGVVETDGVNLSGYSTEKHPDTGVVFKGFKIPYWEEMQSMLREAAKTFKTGYFGWDIAITETGPVIIEVNTSPGSVILQTPYVPMKKGMGHLVAPYVDPKDVATKYPFKNEDEKYIEMVAEEAECTREEAIEKITEAYELYGMECDAYAARQCWKLSEEEMRTQFTAIQKNFIRANFNRNPKLMKTVASKELSCKYFDKFLNRKYLSTKDIDFDKFNEMFGSTAKVIYKPIVSSGGKGIEVFELGESLEDAFNNIKEYPEGILEEYIVQHDEMNRFCESSVNTMRVVTIKTNRDIEGLEKNKVNILYCALRCGTGDAVVDNLSSGGIVAIVNKDTGVIETDAVDQRANVYAQHPNTGVTFKGQTIPFFDKVLPMIEEASVDIDEAFLGWDIAITKDGPVLVEVNSNPGANLIQAPYHAVGKGMKYIFENYFDA